MKSLLALALFVGVALSGSTSYYGWTPEREFVYRFESEVLTGIPDIKNHYSGVKLTSDVLVQSKSDFSLVIQFTNPRFNAVNGELILRQGKPLVPAPTEEIPEHLAKYLKQAFLVHLKAGVVESFFVDENEPVMVTNIKRSLLSQIQMDISATRRSEVPRSNSILKGVQEEELTGGERKSFFTTEESTVSGDCQVDYTMLPMAPYEVKSHEASIVEEEKELRAMNILRGPSSRSGEHYCEGKKHWTITKTVNFDNCLQRPVYQTETGTKSFCDGSKAQCKDLFTQMSTTKYVVCGESPEEFIIRDVVNENTASSNSMRINTPEKTQTKSHVSLYLSKIKSSASPIHVPTGTKEKTSLVFEYPNESIWSSKSHQTPSPLEALKPMPSLHDGSTMFPVALSPSEIKSQVIRKFETIVTKIYEFPESCSEKTDVAGTIQAIAMSLRSLSYNDLKDLDREIKSHFSSEVKKYELALNLFNDVLSMVGTNPAVLIVKEKVIGNKVKETYVNLLIQSTLRNVRTPTQALLKELVSMAKNLKSGQQYTAFYSTMTQLSNLMYRACIEPSRSVSEFPVRVFGRFCSKETEVLTNEWIPFLVNTLESRNSHNETFVAISALGKIGHKKALIPLTKVIEGKYTQDSLIRSSAVYALKRLSKQEPTIVKPILLSIIDNLSEETQVRLAAVAILPWAQPSVAELQRMAVRSWFEPSKQVAALVFSTLATLPDTVIPELKPIGQKAYDLRHLVKPFKYGIQFSHSRHINQFMPNIRVGGVATIERIGSSESLIPNRIGLSNTLYGELWEANVMSWTSYTRGMDRLVENVINWVNRPETSSETESALNKIKEILRIKLRSSRTPPSSMNQIKFLGLERFVRIQESDIVDSILRDIRSVAFGASPKSFDWTRAINGFSTQVILPTTAGIPLYVENVAPMVWSVKSTLKTDSSISGKANFDLEILSSTNIKFFGNMGIISPFNKKFYGAGVEAALHVSAPFQVLGHLDVRGQLTLTVKMSEKLREEVPLLRLRVKPYTVVKSLERIESISQSSGVSLLVSGRPRQTVQKSLLSEWGIKSALNIDSDYMNLDFATLVNNFREQSIISFGMIPMTLKYIDISMTMNPVESTTKEIKLKFNLYSGNKHSQESELELIRPLTGERHALRGEKKEIEYLCRSIHTSQHKIRSCIEKGLRADVNDLEKDLNEIESVCREGKFTPSQIVECAKGLSTCAAAIAACKESAGSFCPELRRSCVHEVKVIENMIYRASKMGKGYYHGLNIEASLESHYGRRAVSAMIITGVTESEGKFVDTNTEITFDAPHSPAYEIVLSTKTKVPEVLYRWNLQSLVEQNIKMDFAAKLIVGSATHTSEDYVFTFNSVLEKSHKQKESVQNSPEYQRCLEEEQKGRTLSTVCSEVRHEAASLNKITAEFAWPENFLQRCPIIMKFASGLQSVFVPYIKSYSGESLVSGEIKDQIMHKIEESIRGIRGIEHIGSGELRKASLSGETSRTGDEITVLLTTPTGSAYRLNNIRVPLVFRQLVPLSVRNGFLTRVIQKVTKEQEPASCTVDKHHISTFDNRTYSYNLNTCEHLLFKDCSSSRPVAVTAQAVDQEGHLKAVKAVLGANIVEMKRGGHSRSSGSVEIQVNGETKSVPTGEYWTQKGQQNTVVLRIFRNKDNVVSVEDPAEGVIVFFDGSKIEVVAPQWLFNRACGLCGDLNGENTADLRSPGFCLLRHNRFGAYSYMMQESTISISGHSAGSCPGVPTEDRPAYEREVSECTKSQIIKTPVTGLARSLLERSPKPLTVKHLIRREKNRICFSKTLVKVCSGKSNPTETRNIPVQFACFTMPSSKGAQIEKRVEAGEVVTEISMKPTVFTQSVPEVLACSGDYSTERMSGSGENYRTFSRHGGI